MLLFFENILILNVKEEYKPKGGRGQQKSYFNDKGEGDPDPLPPKKSMKSLMNSPICMPQNLSGFKMYIKFVFIYSIFNTSHITGFSATQKVTINPMQCQTLYTTPKHFSIADRLTLAKIWVKLNLSRNT